MHLNPLNMFSHPSLLSTLVCMTLLVPSLLVQAISLSNNTLSSWLPFSVEKYSHMATLKTFNNKEIYMFWKILEGDKEIEIAVASKNGANWLGIGVSQSGGMRGASIWVGRKRENDFVLEYRFTDQINTPELDNSRSNEMSLLQNYQTADMTAFVFKTAMKTCATKYTDMFTDKPIWFIYALGTSNDFTKHAPGDNGQELVDLSGNFFPNGGKLQTNVNYKTMDLINHPVTLNGSETTYCYRFFNLENTTKSHIVMEEAVISTEASPYVHHMLGYLCDRVPNGISLDSNTCSNSTQLYMNDCTRTYILWGKGGKPRVYPDNVGKPIGQGILNTKYILLETHYANPGLVKGVTDTGSGMRLTLAPQLRQHDVGVLFLGTLHDFIKIPAGKKEYALASECPSRCTNAITGIPKGGITVLTYNVHMHRRGIAGYTQIVRDGKEITPMTRMNYFDFNYQNAEYVPVSQQKLYAGDRLITTCVWDSSKDTKVVSGGISSEEEMCINFVEYYPVMPLFSCGQVGQSLTAPNAFICLTQHSDGTTDNGNNFQGVLAATSTDFPYYLAMNNSLVNKCNLTEQTVNGKNNAHQHHQSHLALAILVILFICMI